MKYCTKCVQPDTRPNIKFDAEGVCPACRYAEELPFVDWGARHKELASLIERTKKNNHSGYDCIIGVSGGKDSTRQAMYARERACGKERKAAKAAGRIPAGQKWPQYWSECNKRMKAQGM